MEKQKEQGQSGNASIGEQSKPSSQSASQNIDEGDTPSSSEAIAAAAASAQETPKDEGTACDTTATTDTTPATEANVPGEQEQRPSTRSLPPVVTTMLKKARTGYFIFADEKRPELQAAHPGEAVGVIARHTGQLWGAITPEEKEGYLKRAAEEKEHYARQLALHPELRQKQHDHNNNNKRTNISDLTLPLARMRKIVKLDPDVRGVSKEAMLLITKCTELFTAKLGHESVKIAGMQNRRKLLPKDIAELCGTREVFAFLREDVRDLLKDQAEEHRKKTEDNAAVTAAAAAKNTTTDATHHNGGQKIRPLSSFWK